MPVDPFIYREDPLIGTKVHYIIYSGSTPWRWENGIVKGVMRDERGRALSLFVVYSCDGDWANFRNYTGQNSSLENLRLGWKEDLLKMKFERV